MTRLPRGFGCDQPAKLASRLGNQRKTRDVRSLVTLSPSRGCPVQASRLCSCFMSWDIKPAYFKMTGMIRPSTRRRHNRYMTPVSNDGGTSFMLRRGLSVVFVAFVLGTASLGARTPAKSYLSRDKSQQRNEEGVTLDIVDI